MESAAPPGSKIDALAPQAQMRRAMSKDSIRGYLRYKVLLLPALLLVMATGLVGRSAFPPQRLVPLDKSRFRLVKRLSQSDIEEVCSQWYDVDGVDALRTQEQFDSATDWIRKDLARLDENSHVSFRRRIGCLYALLNDTDVCSDQESLACNEANDRVDDLAIQYFEAYVPMAMQHKELVYYHHLSKTGGTAVCHTMWLNGCRAPGNEWYPNLRDPKKPVSPEGQVAGDGANCWSKAFGDKFVWFARSNARESLGARQNFTCQDRLDFAKKIGFNFMANEGALPEGLDERPCHKGILSVQTLREPVRRTISHLAHMINDGYSVKDRAGRACRKTKARRGERDGLNDFNLTCYAQLQHVSASNYMTRMIIGGDAHRRKPEDISYDDEKLARKIVSMFDVLILPGVTTTSGDDSASDLMWSVGVGLPHKFSDSQRNVRSYRPPSDEDLTFLRRTNRHDIGLYNFGLQLYTLDSLVYKRASEACKGTIPVEVDAVPIVKTACELLATPADGRWRHHKSWMADRRKRNEGFACGCGWAGASSHSKNIPQGVPDINQMPNYQKCPRPGLLSPMNEFGHQL
mmetsp:Transcript_31787/g.77825  ORF Transcript_31787/g.77825 Transcript_31787/m.77825 type:complete len:575 (-) Transcript_31787:25-1749(-)